MHSQLRTLQTITRPPFFYTPIIEPMFEAKTKLHQILHDKGWKVKDLERALHERGLKIEYYALTEYANGKRKNMTIETLNKLCVTLDVTPNDLVEIDAKPLPHKQRRVPTSHETPTEELQDDNHDQEVKQYEEHVKWSEDREADIWQKYQKVEKELKGKEEYLKTEEELRSKKNEETEDDEDDFGF